MGDARRAVVTYLISAWTWPKVSIRKIKFLNAEGTKTCQRYVTSKNISTAQGEGMAKAAWWQRVGGAYHVSSSSSMKVSCGAMMARLVNREREFDKGR